MVELEADMASLEKQMNAAIGMMRSFINAENRMWSNILTGVNLAGLVSLMIFVFTR